MFSTINLEVGRRKKKHELALCTYQNGENQKRRRWQQVRSRLHADGVVSKRMERCEFVTAHVSAIQALLISAQNTARQRKHPQLCYIIIWRFSRALQRTQTLHSRRHMHDVHFARRKHDASGWCTGGLSWVCDVCSTYPVYKSNCNLLRWI